MFLKRTRLLIALKIITTLTLRLAFIGLAPGVDFKKPFRPKLEIKYNTTRILGSVSWNQKYFIQLKKAPAYYNAGVVCSWKFISRRIDSRQKIRILTCWPLWSRARGSTRSSQRADLHTPRSRSRIQAWSVSPGGQCHDLSYSVFFDKMVTHQNVSKPIFIQFTKCKLINTAILTL
jgi:hypothetical protein